MHEFSIARSLISLVEDIAVKNGGKVCKIFVKIGKLSGVEPYLLKTAFDTLKEDHISLKDTVLIINFQDIVCRCRGCGTEFSTSEFDLTCKNCGSYDTDIVDGKDMFLESVELKK